MYCTTCIKLYMNTWHMIRPTCMYTWIPAPHSAACSAGTEVDWWHALSHLWTCAIGGRGGERGREREREGERGRGRGRGKEGGVTDWSIHVYTCNYEPWDWWVAVVCVCCERKWYLPCFRKRKCMYVGESVRALKQGRERKRESCVIILRSLQLTSVMSSTHIVSLLAASPVEKKNMSTESTHTLATPTPTNYV